MSRIDEALSKADRKRRISETHGSGVYKVLLERSAPAKRKKPWILLIVFAILLGIGFYYHSSNHISVIRPKPVTVPDAKKTPSAAKHLASKEVSENHPKSVTVTDAGKTPSAVKQVAPEKLPEQENRLPSNILSASPDHGYSATHPGWQRYETEALDYRVFREGKKVKALQVIARREKAITAAFFDSFLNEIANKEPFRVQSSETRGASFVEKGVVGKKAEVVVYRKKPAGEIEAFVVAYL